MNPINIAPIVEVIATNLSYPSNSIIDTTNGTNTSKFTVIPVRDSNTANIITVKNMNLLLLGFTFVTIISNSFL